jgi:hypothetical protein
MAVIAGILVTGAARASTSSTHAGRGVGYFSANTNATVSVNFSQYVRLTAVTAVFSTPFTGTITVVATINGQKVSFPQTVSGATTVVFNPTALWLNTSDKTYVVTSSNITGQVVFDYEY